MWAARALFAFAMSSAILLSAGEALGQRVVLVRPKNSDRLLQEAFTRLQAELSLNAFEVTIIDAAEETVMPAMLVEAARKGEAFASISFDGRIGATAANVWIVDRVTGKTSMRSLSPSRTEDAPGVLAIRAVDLLRASLREYGPAEPPPPEIRTAEVKPPRAVSAWIAPRPPPWLFSTELALVDCGPSIGISFGASLGLRRRLSDWFQLGLTVLLPIGATRWETARGTALIRQGMGTVEGELTFLHGGWGRLGAAVGAGYYRLEADGLLNPPLTSTSDSVNGFIATTGLRAEARVFRQVAIVGAATAALRMPRAGVAIGTTRIALREPLLSFSTGLAVGF